MLDDKSDNVLKNALIAIYNMSGKNSLINIIEDNTIFSVRAKDEARKLLDEIKEYEDDL